MADLLVCKALLRYSPGRDAIRRQEYKDGENLGLITKPLGHQVVTLKDKNLDPFKSLPADSNQGHVLGVAASHKAGKIAGHQDQDVIIAAVVGDDST